MIVGTFATRNFLELDCFIFQVNTPGLDEEIAEVIWGRSIGEKQFKYISGFTAVSMVPVFGDKSVPVEGRR